MFTTLIYVVANFILDVRDTLQTNLETSWRYRNDVSVSAGRSVVEKFTIAAATVGCNPPATFIKYKTLAVDFDHT